MKKIDYMKDTLDFCLWPKDIIARFANQEVIVYGTNNECYRFLSVFANHLKMKYIINHYSDEEFQQLNAEDLRTLKFIRKYEPIFVLSHAYWREIVTQLEQEGYVLGVDIFFWEQSLPLDSYNISDFIEHNKKIWASEAIHSQNKILIPFEPVTYGTACVSLAYPGNYLGKLYNAEIWGYLQLPYGARGWMYNSMYDSKSTWEIAKSYNCSNILDCECDDRQMKIAEGLFHRVWESINTWKELKNLVIDGIHFGISFIREYIRAYVPSLNLKSESFATYLFFAIQRIVFLKDYFKKNSIKAVTLIDGVTSGDNLLRDIAIANGVPCYTPIYYSSHMKCFPNFHSGGWFKYYKNFFEQLSKKEQQVGIEWAKKSLDARLSGSKAEIPYMEQSVYSVKSGKRVLEKNDKIKCLICPHAMTDDLYCFGWQVFSCMIEWLDHLGKLSEQTDYDWYLKMHPMQCDRDKIFLESFLKAYPKIKLIPTMVSPIQLRDEGLQFAFTIWGTIGHEYPALGIHVINAGNNPHISFDFDINPKTEEEFDRIVFNLEKVARERTIDMQEIYKFYCINFLYYNAPTRDRGEIFFKNPESFTTPPSVNCDPSKLAPDYKRYLDEWTPEWHEITKRKVRDLFIEMDNFRDDIFYKKDVKLINEKLTAMGIENI